MPTVRSKCARCGRSFKRLDTHLRVSVTCRDIHRSAECRSTPPPSSISSTASVASNLNSIATLPANLNYTHGSAVTTENGTTTSARHFKQSLRLPKTAEEWDEANALLSAVTSLVLQAITVEEKNIALCDGIYNTLSSRFGVQPSHQSKNHSQPNRKQHDRALKRATRLKNEARKALREARRQGESESVILSLSGKFLSLLRDHSRLRCESARRLQSREAKFAREECHQNFWRYAKGLLDGSATSLISPDFSASTAHAYFTEVYKSSPHHFETPSWMPSPPPPVSDSSMSMSPITQEELYRVIRKSKSTSAPSPLDRISYTIIKRCPSLHPALLDLFNRVIMVGAVPLAWKMAAVKLIPKGTAEQDPSSPANFRPIALTPTISKLLSGVLKDRCG